MHYPPPTSEVDHPGGLSRSARLYALAPLVGRDIEMASLCEMVGDPSTRLVTLTGPEGVGKSRLAVALLDAVSPSFPDGARYVDLASVDADANLADVILRAVAVPEHGSGDPEATPLARLADCLGDCQYFLVLDHCEHLTASVVTLLATLLIECPGVHVLVAIQEPLRIYGECLFRLTPLELPGPGHAGDLAALKQVAAVELFLLRARSARPGFALTHDNHLAVSELCKRLDGLPLAIELAARRVKLYSISELLAELDNGIGLLHGTATDTLSRHRSMREAVEWSCARLTETERFLLIRLAVFASAFGLADADAVICQQGASCRDQLEALVDKNLLMLTERARGHLGFSMLATTRAYALEEFRRSGDMAEVQHRHAHHFLRLAEAAEGDFAGPRRSRAIVQFSLARDDLHVAFRYFADHGDGCRAGALAALLRPFWFASGRLREGAKWLEEALTLGIKPSALLARVLDADGEIRVRLGDPTAGDRLRHALSFYREIGDISGAGRSLHHLALHAHMQGSAEAGPLYEQAIDTLTEAGDTAGHAAALADLTELRVLEGNHEEAQQPGQLAVRLSRKIADPHGTACGCRVLAAAALAAGDVAGAEEMSREAIRLLHATGDIPALAENLEMLAAALVQRQKRGECWTSSTRLLAACQAIYQRSGYRPLRHLAMPPEQLLERARIRLGDETYRDVWAAGSALSPAAAATEALAPVPAVADSNDAEQTPLTPREYEVAELVARGLTNREVARRLGIAEWTAVNHLRKVMRKLGCPSRVHVANWVGLRHIRKSAVAPGPAARGAYSRSPGGRPAGPAGPASAADCRHSATGTVVVPAGNRP